MVACLQNCKPHEHLDCHLGNLELRTWAVFMVVMGGVVLAGHRSSKYQYSAQACWHQSGIDQVVQPLRGSCVSGVCPRSIQLCVPQLRLHNSAH